MPSVRSVPLACCCRRPIPPYIHPFPGSRRVMEWRALPSRLHEGPEPVQLGCSLRRLVNNLRRSATLDRDDTRTRSWRCARLPMTVGLDI